MYVSMYKRCRDMLVIYSEKIIKINCVTTQVNHFLWTQIRKGEKLNYLRYNIFCHYFNYPFQYYVRDWIIETYITYYI